MAGVQRSLRRTGNLTGDNRLHAWSCCGHGSNYFIGNMDIQMNINEEIAAEFKRGYIEAVAMIVSVMGLSVLGIMMITGAG